MSSESQNDQKPAMGSHHPAPPRTDPLPCPRCASTSTKFCYYNNYNLSQPRYFCKGCRRYWTQGGTLRNVPVGGGTRKSSNSKRHRSCPSSSTNTNTTTSSSSSSSTVTHEPGPESEPEPILLPIPANPVSVLPVKGEMGSNVMMNLNESLALPMNLNESYPAVSGNFATLLDIQGGGGYGLDEMGLGFGPTRIWPFLDTTGYLGVGGVNGNNNNGGGGGGSSTVGCNNNNNTWQMGDVENVDGDCYGWPGLAISTSGKGLK